MTASTKRKTSVTLSAALLDRAKELEINVLAVAEAALLKAVNDANSKHWLAENANQFAAQADWHARNGHPLAEIIAAQGACTWRS